jgi:hypothetical protein
MAVQTDLDRFTRYLAARTAIKARIEKSRS